MARDALGPSSVTSAAGFEHRPHATRVSLGGCWSCRRPWGGSRGSRRVNSGPAWQRDYVYTERGRLCPFHFIFSKSIIGLFYNTKFTEKGRDLRGVGTQEALGAGGDAPVPALAARGGRRAGSWPERADSCLVPRAPVPWIWPVAAARRHLARLRLVLTLPGAATGRSGEGRGRAAAAFASEPLVLKGP